MTFVKANKETYIYGMKNVDKERKIHKGEYYFHITSDTQTKYLDSREIAIYHPSWGDGVYFGYKGDWDEFNPHHST